MAPLSELARGHRLRLAGLVVCLMVLTACGAGSAATSPMQPAATATSSSSVLTPSRPTRLQIPSIGVDTALIELGLRPDGTMEVPPDGREAGWYTESPTPGEIGPAVLVAHVDWKGAKGVFYDLRDVKPGGQVTVDRADGSRARFAVRRVDQYPKEQFPTDTVYGDVKGPELRLITCGGSFDPRAHSYRDNIVVYAQITSSEGLQ